MTTVTSLLEKVNSRLNSALLLKARRAKKHYGIINVLSISAFLGGASILFTVGETNDPMLVLSSMFLAMIGFFSIFAHMGDLLKASNQCKMVINNDNKSLADEYSQELLTIEEVNELFCLQLPNYVLNDLYSKIKDGSNLYYVELLKIHKMLELGQEHYHEKQAEEENRISEGVDNFIKKYQLNDSGIKIVQQILESNNKNKQHTKTFNSRKVL